MDKLLKDREPVGSSAYYTGRIITPHSLPLFRDTNPKKTNTKRQLQPDGQDPSKRYCPEPPSSGIKMGEGTSSCLNFTQYIVSSKKLAMNKNIMGKDPREELFRYREGKTFLKSDTKILAEKTIEEEEDEQGNK